jgi:acyl-CoA synthetase (AMP-forming)/AMP-acid ligase II
VTAPASLVENLIAAATRYPDRCAVQDGAQHLRYGDLLKHAASIARHLRSQGLQSGERVACILANSAEFVAAYYGVLMAGGVAVLLNAAGKSRDFAAWLRDCEPRFVLLDANHADAAAAVAGLSHPPQVWKTSGDATAPFGFADGLGASGLGLVPEKIAAAESAPLAAPFKQDDPACILYTSGTSSRPKGVVLSHGNLASNTASIVRYLGLNHEDSIVTVLPFYYSYGSSVLNTHVLAGARLILEKNLVYPHAVVENLARERATGFAGVPSTFALLLSRVKLHEYDLSALRYVTQAGGAMPAALTQKLREALPRTSVFVMYGQTEATARLSYLPPEHLERKPGSVGIAIPGVTLEVRNEQGSAAAMDEVGEVWASGPNVMLGYWRNDSATADVKRDGWLKTGDMGRVDSEGFLYLVGRRSDMIKSGAHRIHPQDIEDAIAELPQVREVAVVGVEDALLGQSIRAFVVLADAAVLSPMQIQAHCRERLANYKIPKTVTIVASLPRTASGKIRRAELLEAP